MMEVVQAAKNILTANLSINHLFVGDYDDFIPENYPAVCIQPEADTAVLEDNLSFDFDDIPRLSIYYVEKAPENRDKINFIQKMDELKAILKNNPTLDNSISFGAQFTFVYSRRNTEDNIEFITKIEVEGRRV
ncbi:MAG: hypothetical protein MI740_10495 [Halanaerobiales bacterium]|nr:hypothetical protein [Halanaerobiales bacterium]